MYSPDAANLGNGGVLTSSGNGVYIFRVASSLVTIATSSINLIGAQAIRLAALLALGGVVAMRQRRMAK